MFLVQQQGRTIRQFHLFVDAWLFCFFEMPVYGIILQGTDRWVVNPSMAN